MKNDKIYMREYMRKYNLKLSPAATKVHSKHQNIYRG